MNGMMYIRGNREDYDGWAAMGNPGWSYADVLPYFKKSEDNLNLNKKGSNLIDPDLHATGGPLPVTEFNYHPPLSGAILRAAHELGFDSHDLNGANSTGFMIAQTTSKNGVRMSAARAFLRPAQSRPNLHIMLNTTVTKILLHPKSKNAHGVETIDFYGHTSKILAKKEVIVSGGAVSSPQILMLSGIGPKEELERVTRSLHNNMVMLIFSFNSYFRWECVQLLTFPASERTCRIMWPILRISI